MSCIPYRQCCSTVEPRVARQHTHTSPLLFCRVGRKVLFAEGGIQMFICFVVVAAVMGTGFNKVTGEIPQHSASAILAFECLFTAGFASSWGPLGWLVPSEFHNIETRGHRPGHHCLRQLPLLLHHWPVLPHHALQVSTLCNFCVGALLSLCCA